jgi:hypothetical protein
VMGGHCLNSTVPTQLQNWSSVGQGSGWGGVGWLAGFTAKRRARQIELGWLHHAENDGAGLAAMVAEERGEASARVTSGLARCERAVQASTTTKYHGSNTPCTQTAEAAPSGRD